MTTRQRSLHQAGSSKNMSQPGPAENAESPTAAVRVWALAVRHLLRHRHMAFVVAAYAVAAVIVPTLAPVALWDDWVYVRAAEDLSQRGELAVPPPAAANVVFQAAWGAVFQVFLGPSPGVLRLSTVVLVLLGGLAVYGTSLELNCPAPLAALASAIYLFNPLSFVLAYSFMTDAPYTALVAISAYWFVRAARRGALRDYVLGSGAVAAAFLIRPQALVLLLSLWAFLIFRLLRERNDLRGALRRALAAAALPLLAVGLFTIWSGVTGDGPRGQGHFAQVVSDAGFAGTWTIFRKSLFAALAYAGFLLIPLLALLVLSTGVARRGLLLTTIALALSLLALDVALAPDRYMPFAPSWLEQAGLGPNDTSGRMPFFSVLTVRVVTGLAFAAIAVAVALVVRHVGRCRPTDALSVLMWLLLGQFAAVLLPSFAFGAPLDRYLLPLFPIVVVIAAWLVRDQEGTPAVVGLGLAWGLTALGGVVSVVDTRNLLVVQESKWQIAQQLTDGGVPLNRISAGPAWDGYKTYAPEQESLPLPPPDPLSRWWLGLWGRTIDSTHLVWGEQLEGYHVVHTETVDQWWRPDSNLYVNVRVRVGPPA
jgi:hypothetical protein